MTIDLHPLDWAVIFGYLILILIIGFAAARRVKDTHDYFLGGRSFNIWLLIAQSFGVGTHAEMPVSLTGATFKSGYAAIWYQWKNLFITPFYWILAPIFRRCRCTTIGEFYENRYGQWMGGVYSVFALSYFIFNLGAMMKGAGKLVSAAAGGTVEPNTVVFVMTLTFLAYSFVGGLYAAAYTDFAQSFFIIALSFMLVPLGLAEIGGFTAVRRELPEHMLTMVAPGDIGLFMIVILTINGLIGIMAQPHMLAAVGTGKDERTCRIGFAYGNFTKRFCTIGWALTGLIVVVMVMQRGVTLPDPELAFGYATRALLAPGFVGLMIACVLAANMSTCSAMMVDGGALFTQNLYRRYLRKGATDRHYLMAGRWSGLGITALGILFGFYVDSVLEAFLFTETIAAFMGISMFGAMCWKRSNRWGALASLATSSLVFFTMTERQFGEMLKWDAWNCMIALIAGFTSLIVVSLLTRREPESMTQPFYEHLDTPSYLDEATGEEKTLHEEGHELLILKLGDLRLSEGLGRFYRRFRVDINGLVVAFGVVVALIVLARAILWLP
ncbi:MAG: sodium:solute symporter family protein [Bryobacterales bacterium]|nr:sodium:solute symporter family protein [Bryobacterales bacterium]